VGVVLVFRDVSERRTAELEKQASIFERERLLESERAARSEAQRAARLKDEFVATLSHELRTPLNAIIGWVHVLQAGATDAKTLQQALDVIDRSAHTQAQLVSDLLDMSRILSGKMHLEVHSVEIASVLEAALETVKPAADSKQIEIDRTFEAVPPVMGDSTRLQQVVWNLIANAIKFTPQGGRVNVVVRRVDSVAEIVISDTGVGIRPEFLQHVFDRFRQGDGSMTRQFGGLGLGLSLVKQLVELHGGSVTAESEGEGCGSTFRVRLPIGSVRSGRSPMADSDDPCERIGAVAAERLKNLRVLIVEDERDTRDLVVRMLHECGASVSEAASGPEALEIMKTRRPDVLICDIGMPGMDGYTLIQRIRNSPEPRLSRVPAIALTAYARPEDRTRALRAGYQAHLVKPMDPAELIATVASFADLIDGGGSEDRD
jgi:CheY-like chemotaxis protein